MYLEFALICALTWIPSLYASVAEYGGWRKPSVLGVDEVFAAFSSLAMVSLPIFLIWRNGEPFRKFGFRPFEWRDLVVAAVLVLGAVLLHIASRSIIQIIGVQSGALTTIRIHHGFPLPVEAPILLVAAFREEIFYRAYACARMRDFGLNQTRVAVLSALAFASVHLYQGWALLPVHFFFGLMFAAVFLKFRSIWPLAVAHASYNLLLLAGTL